MRGKFFESLKSKKDFLKLSGNCKKISNNEYIFKYDMNDYKKLRFAISPSKKFFKKAVLRNKIKRQVRTFIQSLDSFPSMDMIIIIKSNYNEEKYAKNKLSFISLIKKVVCQEQ